MSLKVFLREICIYLYYGCCSLGQSLSPFGIDLIIALCYGFSTKPQSQSLIYEQRLAIISIGIRPCRSNYIHVNGRWRAWGNNCIHHETMDGIIYPCPNLIFLSNRLPGVKKIPKCALFYGINCTKMGNIISSLIIIVFINVASTSMIIVWQYHSNAAWITNNKTPCKPNHW